MPNYHAAFSGSHIQDSWTAPFPLILSYHDVVMPNRLVESHSLHDSCFAKGKAVCLIQTHDIIQSYLQGQEAFWAQYDVIDGARRDLVLLTQIHDTIIPDYRASFQDSYSTLSFREVEQRFGLEIVSQEGQVAYPQTLDIKTVNAVDILTLFSIDREIPFTEFCGGFSIDVENLCLALFQYDVTCTERFWVACGTHNMNRYSHALFAMASSFVQLDILASGPRIVAQKTIFDATETAYFALQHDFDIPPSIHHLWDSRYEQLKTGNVIVYLQEEAIYEYSATLTDVITGREITIVSASMTGFVDHLAPDCVGDTEWEMELATSVRYYDVSRKPVFENPIRWRFQSHDQKHYRDAPGISEISVVKLESSFELRFEVHRSYQTIEHLIEIFQFQPMEEEDFFDLGIWRSDSFLIDTNEPPLLTIPFRSDQSDYFIHVPREPNTKFLGIAPIRKFPMAEIGILTQIFIP